MTKEGALRDLKSLAEAVSVVSENQEKQNWVVSRFVWQNWNQRLKKIIKALES